MNTIQSFNAWAWCAQQRPGKVFSIQQVLRLSFILVLGTILLSSKLQAQEAEVHWVDKGNYQLGYQLSSAASSFQANEHVSVRLYLKTIAPLECFGGSFELEVSNLIDLHAANPFDLSPNSPMGSISELETAFEWLPGSSTASLSIHRTDSTPRHCDGMLGKVNFIVGNTGLTSAELVQSLDGGIMTMDNIDMKQHVAWEEAESSIDIYPNPFQEWIQVDRDAAEEYVINLLNLQGGLILKRKAQGSEKLFVGDQKAGIYLIEILSPAGQRIELKKMIKR